MFTETALFRATQEKQPFSKRATQIFQKLTKVVVNSQINVSFSPAPI
jgi:hypothetical protein